MSLDRNINWICPFFHHIYSSPQSKELWHERIHQSINKIKDKEGKSNTTIQISYWDQLANEEKYTLVKVTNRDTTVDAIKASLNEFKCEGDLQDYQLWVKTSRDDTPYPLIGHEYPFAIKMNFVRDLLHRSNLDLQNFNNIAADNKCIFILRKSYPKNSTSLLENSSKKSKNKRKPINWPFKKIILKPDISLDSGISSEPSTPTKAKLFGQHLDLLCNEETLPKPILNMLKELFVKGPFIVGIFRKSANARVCKEFRAKLETDPNSDMTEVPVIVIASVFKEFLRSLPDCLLQSSLYTKWIEAISFGNNMECRERVYHLLHSLPATNILLLRHFLCALWYISQQSASNKMCAVNLGVCVGQSLLSPNAFGNPNPVPPTSQRCEEMSKQVPKLIAYLIDHCPDLLGEHTLTLLGPSPQDKDLLSSSRQDSGAEESDSLNSLPDNGVGGSNTSSNGNRCDDSSIDSLERALMDDTRVSPGAQPDSGVTFANKMSLSNLSRDSGLTLSDTQLYTPEDEECDSDQFNANSAYRKSSPLVYPYLTKSVPHLDQTGLESDINVTFSYGRSVGVSIDGSCHDVVMRKRRHQAIQPHDYPHYINRNSRNGDSAPVYGHNHNNNHNYRHNNHNHRPTHHFTTSHHNSTGYHHYSHSPPQHIPIHYSKSYSYGINGDNLTDEDNINDSHREYRYRRPPLAAVLGGAPISSGHTFQDQISGQYLRRSNSEESLVRSYADADNDLNRYSMANGMSLQYPQTVQSWTNGGPQSTGKCCTFKPVSHQHFSNNCNNNQTINNSSTQVTLRADVHHYEHYHKSGANQFDSSGNTNNKSQTNGRIGRKESVGNGCKTQQQMIAERVGSICSSSSETASQRSSISKQSSNVSKHSSSPRSTGMSANAGIVFPPSYQEAMNRKEMLCRAQSNASQNQMTLRKTSSASTSSATSNHIYEESVRIYNSDLDNKHNITHRAVPVRVKSSGMDSDTSSDAETSAQVLRSRQSAAAHKQVLQRAVSDGQVALMNGVSNGGAGARIVRISAQNHNHNNVNHNTHNPLFHPSLPSHTSHPSAAQPQSPQLLPNVSVLQRSAKDFTPEEWKKDINCNVATLRKLFASSTQTVPTQTQPTHQSSPNSCLGDTNTYNIYVRQSVRPVSVLIETNNNTINTKNGLLLKQRPNSIQETTSSLIFNDSNSFKSCHESKGQTNRVGQDLHPCNQTTSATKAITVVHVGQTDGLTGGKPQIITVHKRADSVGNSSSEEESYV